MTDWTTAKFLSKVQLPGSEQLYYLKDLEARELIDALGNAMHFIGVATEIETTPSGSWELTTSDGKKWRITPPTGQQSPKNGDVAICGNKEVVWTGSKWEEFGDLAHLRVNQSTMNGTAAITGTITAGETAGSYTPAGSISQVVTNVDTNASENPDISVITGIDSAIKGGTLQSGGTEGTAFSVSGSLTSGAVTLTTAEGSGTNTVITGINTGNLGVQYDKTTSISVADSAEGNYTPAGTISATGNTGDFVTNVGYDNSATVIATAQLTASDGTAHNEVISSLGTPTKVAFNTDALKATAVQDGEPNDYTLQFTAATTQEAVTAITPEYKYLATTAANHGLTLTKQTATFAGTKVAITPSTQTATGTITGSLTGTYATLAVGTEVTGTTESIKFVGTAATPQSQGIKFTTSQPTFTGTQTSLTFSGTVDKNDFNHDHSITTTPQNNG